MKTKKKKKKPRRENGGEDCTLDSVLEICNQWIKQTADPGKDEGWLDRWQVFMSIEKKAQAHGNPCNSIHFVRFVGVSTNPFHLISLPFLFLGYECLSNQTRVQKMNFLRNPS